MKFAFFIFLLLLATLTNVNGLFEITNVKCIMIDKTFGKFDYCYFRAVNQTYKYASLKIVPFQPINNAEIQVDLRKKDNGFRPFLNKASVDGCKFLRARKNPAVDYIYSFIKQYSNLNHSCPYNHDIVIDKLNMGFLDSQKLKHLGLRGGDYGAYVTTLIDNIPRIQTKLFFKLKL